MFYTLFKKQWYEKIFSINMIDKSQSSCENFLFRNFVINSGNVKQLIETTAE